MPAKASKNVAIDEQAPDNQLASDLFSELQAIEQQKAELRGKADDAIATALNQALEIIRRMDIKKLSAVSQARLERILAEINYDSATTGTKKASKEDKVSCVDEFLAAQTGDFTMPQLGAFATSKGIKVSGSPKLFFQAALAGKIKEKKTSKGQTVKQGVTIVYQKK